MTARAHDARSLSMYTLSSRAHRQDARSLFSRLSREAPVHWDPYTGTWLVSGRTEAVTACTAEEFSALRMAKPQQKTASSSAGHAHERVSDVIGRQMLFLDGARHTAWRRIMHHVLAPGRVDALAPWVERRVEQLVDSADTGRLDVVGDLAEPLPLDAIANLLGLPTDHLETVRAWSDAYTRMVTGFQPEPDGRADELIAAFMDYALDLVRHARRTPADSGLRALVDGADATGMFTDADIAANLVMLIAAGHQTTTGFLSGAVLERLHPSFGPLTSAPLSEDEVEELLTRVSPSRFVGRVVTRDTTLGGQRLRAGQAVLILLAAANWSMLDARTPTAAAGRSIAFGHGRHHCPGSRLARLEGRIVLRRLFGGEHPPVLHDEPVQWSGNVNLPCPLSLRISLNAPHSEGNTLP
ncbi:MAG TPA: hypothetical protein VFV66_13960 [Nonomuraea sp.]|nr:hypothetical protein [Nonomuraea sp.]